MKKLWLIYYFIPFLTMQGQFLQPGAVLSGPMLGGVELRNATIWLEVSSDMHSLTLDYWKEGHPKTLNKKDFTGPLGAEFNPIQLNIGGLDPNSRYQYRFVLNHAQTQAGGFFQTKERWRWRNPARDWPGSLTELKNYAKISVEGKINEQILRVQFHGADGNNISICRISEKQLMP